MYNLCFYDINRQNDLVFIKLMPRRRFLCLHFRKFSLIHRYFHNLQVLHFDKALLFVFHLEIHRKLTRIEVFLVGYRQLSVSVNWDNGLEGEKERLELIENYVLAL